jgi:tetratricopeptide (TPR) repeat protein
LHKRLETALALHQGGDLEAAEAAYRDALRRAPRNADALHLLGVLCLQRGRHREALALLEKAARAGPGQAAVHNNLGEVRRALGELEGAAASYRKALELAPELVSARSNLGIVLHDLGRLPEAVAALRAAVRLRPDHAPAHYNLGSALQALGELREAEASYRRALMLGPDNPQVHVNLGLVLQAEDRLAEAEASFDAALARDPRCVEALLNLAVLRRGEGRLDEALDLVRRALAVRPDDAGALAEEATILDFQGMPEAAAERLRPLVASGRAGAGALATFAAAARQTGRRDEAIGAIRAHLATAAAQARERALLLFELGRLLDEADRYDEAFAAFAEANALEARRFDPAAHAGAVDALIAAYSAEALARLPRAEARSALPVLIVGMPRTGTSLVEQILASHAKVVGAGEREDLNRLAAALPAETGAAAPYPECVASLERETLDRLARTHLERLANLAPDAARVTDKMPTNFQHLGLVALLFPEARVIHCTREALDTCVSCYFHRFAGHHPYAYDLSDIGAYYREYRRLMAHWRAALAVPILDVAYERLVDDLEGESRRMVGFLGLEWDPRCLEFHESKRVVLTSSYDQVRRPVYRAAIGRHRHYAAHLAPLRAALGEAT